jgi:translocation and assembly module TamA
MTVFSLRIDFRLLVLIFVCSVALANGDGNGVGKAELKIEGVKGELLDNLHAGLSLTRETCETPGWRVKRLFKQSNKELVNAARALGYYRIKIEKKLTFEKQCWQARFTIDPGEAQTITSTDIRVTGDGNSDPDFLALIAKSPVQVGAIVHHGQYENLKRDMEIIAAEKGYFDAAFTDKQLQVDTRQGTTKVILHFASGVRYQVGQLRLHQDVYEEKLLKRYIKFAHGDPYQTSQLVELQKALTDSGYFDSVSVRPDLKAAEQGVVDIDVNLTPRKRKAYQLGIGAATDTGPRVVLGYERRRINRLGHSFEAKATLSPVDSMLSAEYIIPLSRPNSYRLGFRGGYRHQETDASTTTTTSIGANLLGRRNGWRETIAIDWVSEEYTIGDETTDGSLLIPSMAWSRTVADDQIRTRKGYRLNLELRGAHSALLSDASFFQTTLDAKWIMPLWKGRLLLRGEAGAMLIDSFEKLPASYRYYAGGDQSVRGYEYRSLGPTNSDGEVIGGPYLLTSSIEYEHPINDRWAVALFADAGNAFEDWNESIKTSIGPGLRWQSPVGPVRIDLAFPLDNPDESFRIHFSMGPDL